MKSFVLLKEKKSLTLSQLTISPSPFSHFEIGQISFLVQKDAQCSETYKKIIHLFTIY